MTISPLRARFLWGLLFAYAMGRISPLYSDELPPLLIVALHVVPPALLALVHGSAIYRARGILLFAIFSLGFGALS